MSARRLRIEIALIVALKLALLFVIYQAWFSHPLAAHMQVAPASVQQHFFDQPAPPTGGSHDLAR